MRLGPGAIFSFAFLAAMTSAAFAAPICQHNPARLCDHCDTTIVWNVVQAPQGAAAAHSFCIDAWQNLSGLRGFDLVEAPHLGTIRFHTYRIAYRGEKLGHDRAMVRVKWSDRNNNEKSAVVTYDINVVASM